MSADEQACWPWSVLGMPEPDEVRAVKRAYAKRLKSIDRSNPSQFQDLREAYEWALRVADADREQAPRARPSIRHLVHHEDPDPGESMPDDMGADALPLASPEQMTPEQAEIPDEPPIEQHQLDPPADHMAVDAMQVRLDDPPGMSPPTAAETPPEASTPAELLTKIEAALANENAALLRNLMGQIQPGDFAMRREVEHIAFAALSSRLEKREKISRALIKWVDEEFYWLSETRLSEKFFTYPEDFRAFAAKLAKRRDEFSWRDDQEPAPRSEWSSVLDIAQNLGIYALIITVLFKLVKILLFDWPGFVNAILTIVATCLLVLANIIGAAVVLWLLWLLSYPIRFVLRPVVRLLKNRISQDYRDRYMHRLGVNGKDSDDIFIALAFAAAPVKVILYDFPFHWLRIWGLLN